MRDFRFYRCRKGHNEGLVKWGCAELPFTCEQRVYFRIGPFGVEWWRGSADRRDGLFD